MPIRVRIDVNGKDQRTYWIARLYNPERTGDPATYAMGLETKTDLEPWNLEKIESLPKFLHMPGRGGLEGIVEDAFTMWNAREDND